MAARLLPFTLATGLTVWQAVCVEAFISFLLLFVIRGAADGPPLRLPSSMFPIPVGGAVFAGVVVSVSIIPSYRRITYTCGCGFEHIAASSPFYITVFKKLCAYTFCTKAFG